MEPFEIQDEIILLEEKEKIIKRVTLNNSPGSTKIVKTFFQHDNIEIYRRLRLRKHINICPIYEVEKENDSFSVLEEDLGTKTLADNLPVKDVQEFLNYALQICAGVSHLHNMNIVHRDLKPENIYLYQNRVVINDFDISKPIATETTSLKDTQMLGSPGYASPEQYGFSRSDTRSDIYSMGVLFNVLLTGSFIQDELTATQFRPLILKCTQIDRDDRYQNVQEVEQELRRIQSKKSKFTPPGFRSQTRWKQVVALIGYFLMFGLIFVTESSEPTSAYDHFQAKILMAIFIFPIFTISTNYLNIRNLIPTPLKKYKIIGSLLLGVTLFVILILLFVIISGIITSMLPAYQ